MFKLKSTYRSRRVMGIYTYMYVDGLFVQNFLISIKKKVLAISSWFF